MDELVKSIKSSVKIPVIIFPNNVTSISRYANAIWFMSLEVKAGASYGKDF